MGNIDKFETIAAQYDTPERIRVAKVISDAIRAQLVDTKTKSAVDFGCGTGLVGLNLLNEFRSILFLDASQNMTDQVNQKISDMKAQNAQTLCFDFEKGSLPDLHTDYIFMAQVLLHIADYRPVLDKLYDVLNPGGHLIIIDFDRNEKVKSEMVHNGFDQDMLAAEMMNVGYESVASKTFFYGSNIFMGQDASLFILNAKK